MATTSKGEWLNGATSMRAEGPPPGPARPTGWLSVLLLVGIFCCAATMPMQPDSWWQLRVGEEILARGEVPQVDVLSFTAAGRPWPNHEWLAQVVFIALYRLGGVSLLTLVCAAIVTAACAPSVLAMRGPPVVRMALLAGAFVGIAPSFSVRPQVLTGLCFGLTLALLQGRWAWRWLLVPLFALWANLHGGVALGGWLMLCATAAAAWADPGRRGRMVLLTLCCGAATTLTPMGVHILAFPIHSVHRLKALGVEEWRSAGLDSQSLTLYALAALLVGLLTACLLHRRAGSAEQTGEVIAAWPTALWLTAALGFILPAAMSIRNVPYFLLLAAPAVSRLWVICRPDRLAASTPAREPRWLGHALVLLAALGGGAAVACAYRDPPARMGWQPVSDEDALALEAAPHPAYNTYNCGGYLLWFTRRSVFLDSRQDPYPLDFMVRAARAELDGRFKELARDWGLVSAILAAGSPLEAELDRSGWRRVYHNERWVVWVAPAAD
jgi:hypothetical protein